jgi:hypothetical protein
MRFRMSPQIRLSSLVIAQLEALAAALRAKQRRRRRELKKPTKKVAR